MVYVVDIERTIERRIERTTLSIFRLLMKGRQGRQKRLEIGDLSWFLILMEKGEEIIQTDL